MYFVSYQMLLLKSLLKQIFPSHAVNENVCFSEFDWVFVREQLESPLFRYKVFNNKLLFRRILINKKNNCEILIKKTLIGGFSQIGLKTM